MQLKNKTSHLYKVDEIMKRTEVKKANVHQFDIEELIMMKSMAVLKKIKI